MTDDNARLPGDEPMPEPDTGPDPEPDEDQQAAARALMEAWRLEAEEGGDHG